MDCALPNLPCVRLKFDEETSGQVLLLTLDRPEARNAYSQALVDSLVAALAWADAEASVRCVVLTGAGKAFAAGGDLKLMRDHAGMFSGNAVELARRYREGIQRIPRLLNGLSKPLVAAINGPAIGAGLDLACMCDVRVASKRALFGETFVKVGLVPGDGGAFIFPRVGGFAHALELALRAEGLGAERAVAIGLVTHVVEPQDLVPKALQIARKIASNAPLAVQLTRRAFYRAHRQSLSEALETASAYQGVVQNTSDHLEGVEAILQKRPATFKGE
jgi:2-(1,2-epoxy-1,2-dihydrophenyl)acetyl-CoA isomerase